MNEQEFYISLTNTLNDGYRLCFSKGDYANGRNVFIVAEPNQLATVPIVGIGDTLAEAYTAYWQALLRQPLDITK